ncbi:MAG: phosphatase PAP2 family protein [Mycobacterium sp.]|nr:phosphatase PAP2 family protein [Mycobacterium sp.]
MAGTMIRRSARRSALQLVRAGERRLTRRWTHQLPPAGDKLMVALSAAADHSKLWGVLAAGAASVGGVRGRRAAGHGVLAIAVASAAVNGPMKLLFGRRRPDFPRRLRRMPRTSSFPSGHSASAFAFAVAATRELPQAGVMLFPLAAGVAYSRVYLGAHYPGDVIAGGAFGAAVGITARAAIRNFRLDMDAVSGSSAGSPRPAEAILVTSPRAGRSRELARARGALDVRRIHVAEELAIEHVDRLGELLRTADDEPRLVIAAGGDGTVGSVAGRLAGTDNPLGILPLGTGNDLARSLDIPLNPRRAARLLSAGDSSRVDLGRLLRPAEPPKYFAHAATVGLNVDFAKLATRASVRGRLGRLTYLAAAVYAVRGRSTFRCTLEHDGVASEMDLLQLSVISAPVIGGALGLSVKNPHRAEHRLDVIAVEDVPPARLLRAGLFLLMGVERPVAGVRALQVERLSVDSPHPLGLSLDGELDGSIPGRFEAVAGAVRVVVPRRS